MEINNIFRAKNSLSAFINYYECDKHCEQSKPGYKHICICYKDCMSKNQGDNAYTTKDVVDGAKFLLNYLHKIGKDLKGI